MFLNTLLKTEAIQSEMTTTAAVCGSSYSYLYFIMYLLYFWLVRQNH
jgi:hypothetical protein